MKTFQHKTKIFQQKMKILPVKNDDFCVPAMYIIERGTLAVTKEANGKVSKYDEFCIKNEELCIKNEEFCIENGEFCIENGEFCRTPPVRV